MKCIYLSTQCLDVCIYPCSRASPSSASELMETYPQNMYLLFELSLDTRNVVAIDI